LILALPFHSIARVLPQTAASAPLLEHLKQFKSCPITGIHLWFDRPISDLDHAVLLDRTVQWMFHKSRLLRTRARLEAAVEADSNNGDLSHAGSYIELVVSASKNLIDKSRAEIVELVLSEVREFFPAAREAKLLKSAVVKELHATYSPRPGLGAHRPGQTTPWPGVFLAGDWTATGWPATMEGAVRSGYLAAEAVARALGMEPHTLVSPDLAASGLMRFFC
jgi:zeta-carotene desaturase